MFYLDDWSDGARRASVGDVRPRPMLIARDGVGMAHMGRPLASYLCPGVDTERLDRLRGAGRSFGGDFVLGLA